MNKITRDEFVSEFNLNEQERETTEELISELNLAMDNKELFYFVGNENKIKLIIPPDLITSEEPTEAHILINIFNFGPILLPFFGPYQMQPLQQTADGLEVLQLDATLMIPIYNEVGFAIDWLKQKRKEYDEDQEFYSATQSLLQMLMTVQAVSNAENSRLAHKIATHLSRNPKNQLASGGPLWNHLLSRLSLEIKNLARHVTQGFIPDQASNTPAISTNAIDELTIEEAGTFVENENGGIVAWFNERAACYIESRFGSEGKRLAEHVRKLQNSFQFWNERKENSPCEPWLISLGKAILFGEFQEMRARIERKPSPAVPHPIAEKYAIIAQRGNSIGPNCEGALVLFDANKDPICCLMDPLSGAPLKNAASIIEVLEDGARLLSSVYAIKILLALVRKAWEQWVEGNNQLINVIVIRGGWSGFCKWLGVADKTTGKVLPKIRREIKKIMEVLRHGDFHIPSINSKGPLLTFREPIKEDKRQKDLIITINDPLLPDSVDALQGRTHTDRTSRRLVPFPPLPTAPGKLSPDKHGAHARLYLRTLIMLRERASQFARQGWVTVTNEDWRDTARASGLQQSDLETALDHWIETVGWLQRREGEQQDQYRLAPVNCYASAQTMLSDAGNREVEGSINGLKGRATKKRTQKKKETN